MKRSGCCLAALRAGSVSSRKLEDSGEVNGNNTDFSTSWSSIHSRSPLGVSSLFPFQVVPIWVCISMYLLARFFGSAAYSPLNPLNPDRAVADSAAEVNWRLVSMVLSGPAAIRCGWS